MEGGRGGDFLAAISLVGGGVDSLVKLAGLSMHGCLRQYFSLTNFS